MTEICLSLLLHYTKPGVKTVTPQTTPSAPQQQPPCTASQPVVLPTISEPDISPKSSVTKVQPSVKTAVRKQPPPPQVIPPTPELRQAREQAYKAKLELITSREKVTVEKLKLEIENVEKQLTDELGDQLRDETLSMRRWLAKYPDVTLKNVPPFSATGDINDAMFPLPTDVAEDPIKFLRIWMKNYVSFRCGVPQTDRRTDYMYTGPSSLVAFSQGDALAYFQKIIAANRQWSFNTGLGKGEYAWAPINGFIGAAIRTDDEMRRRAELDDPNKMIKRRAQLAKYFLETYARTYWKITEDEMASYLQFAQRMKANAAAFEEFCTKENWRKKIK